MNVLNLHTYKYSRVSRLENVSFDMVLIRLLCRNLTKVAQKSMSVGLILESYKQTRTPTVGKEGVGGRGERGSGVAGMKPSHGFRFNKTYQGYHVLF